MDIFSEIRALNFPEGQYIVVGSGILAAKGIRKTNDLDIVVTPELFENLKSEGWEVLPWTKESIPGKNWLKKDNVEVYIQLSRKTGGISATELLKDAEVIQNIPFITLESLIDFKREYGRPKDFEDIKTIEAYIEKNKIVDEAADRLAHILLAQIEENEINIDKPAKIIWDYMHMHQKLEKADAIFVLGSSDLRVPAYAAELYLDGWAPLIIFSGRDGKGKTMELWGMTEAEKFTEVAKKLGVPDNVILLEKEATNTGDNVKFTKQLLEEKDIYPKKLMLIQKPYMERRTYATFMKQWPGMDFIVTSPHISFEDYPNEERSKDYLINMMVGDLQRIKEYPAKGFQIEQEIPTEVWTAYEQLVQRGYTTHLIKEDS